MRVRSFISLMFAVWLVLARPMAAAAQSPAVEKLDVDGAAVTIYRDAYGVPRVFAQTLRALFFGNGYAVAEDRAWQMEKYRLDAEGRLAELFGDKQLQHDEEVRRDDETPAEWQDQLRQLPPDIQAVMQAYVEGVNRYLEQAIASNTLPAPFREHHWTPAHWTLEDSMAIGGMMGRRFGASGTDQLRNQAVVEFLEKRLGSRDAALKVFNDIAWTDDPAAIPTVGWDEAGRASAASGKPGREVPFVPASFAEANPKLLHEVAELANSDAVYASARQLGLATRWGSYCWVLAPSKTASGNAVLVGGPQMGFATPQIAHEIQLTGAGVDVMGMGFAGVPGVLIGANERLAWTSTSGESHNEDIFAEKLKPGDPHQYLYKGQYRAMEHRVEHLLVKDAPAAVDYDVYRTVHGPVIAWSPDGTTAYAKAMAYFGKEWETTVAFIGLNTARSIQDIPPLAARIASSHNIFVATQDGDIGFWHGGFFPKYAPGADPRFPLSGAGDQDWQGMIPFSGNPQVINPASGIIFNWNNKPGPGWPNYSVPAWGIAHHISNIRNTLEEEMKARGGRLTFPDVQAVAPTIGRRNYIADWLKPGLLAAAEHSAPSPDVRAALDILRYWNDELADGGVAQTIFDAWYRHVREDLFKPALGDLGNKDTFDDFIDSSTVYHALAGAKSSVPLSRDYLDGQSADQVRLKALEEAVDELRRTKGPEMSLWQYHTEWIKFDPLPSIPWYSRGTYIQTVELARPRVHGGWILPPGQSENPDSPHYRDQLALAGWWMYAPMQLMTEAEAQAEAATKGKNFK